MNKRVDLSTLSILEKLISFPTVSHEPINDCVDFLCSLSEQLGFQVHQYPSSETKSNIIAHIGPQEEAIALCGHMDVVPVVGQNWSRDPFSMTIVDDRIYGRGSCDMKAFFASTYAALQRIKSEKLKRGISLIWTHDEEIGCVGAQKLCSTLQEKEIAIAKSILIGEPTSLNIARMHGGHSTLLLKIKGEPAHSSKPQLGVSAILAGMQSIGAIQSVQELLTQKPCVHHEMHNAHSLINIAKIQGGEAVNIIPEHCEILIGIRPMPGESLNTIQEKLEEKVEESLHKIPVHVHWEIIQEAPPMLTRSGTTLEHYLQDVFPLSKSIGLPFATDGGCFESLGAEPIICGPGSINQAHKADEFISQKELFSYTDSLETLLSKWCL